MLGASVSVDVPLLLDAGVSCVDELSVVEELAVAEVEDVELVLAVPSAGPVNGTQSLYTCHTILLSTPWNANQ